MKYYVYILTNEVYHDKEGNPFVKIGITNHIPNRMKQLSSTGVPVPFELFFAIEVDSKDMAENIENRILEGMSFVRYNSNREFLQIKPEDLKSILQVAEIMGAKVVTLDDFDKNTDEIIVKKTNKSYPSLEHDLIICPADDHGGFENVFIKLGEWWGGDGGLRIAKNRIGKLKYLAIYKGKPEQNITHYGEIEDIVPDHREDKSDYSKIILKGTPKLLNNGPLNHDSESYFLQDRVYSDSKKLFEAKSLSDVLPRKN